MIRYFAPLLIFFGLVVFLWQGLTLNPQEIPSNLIDRPAPAFTLSTLYDENQTISHRSLQGKVWLLNVWASWCVACLHEHPLVNRLAREIPIVGLNYKDKRKDAKRWLAEHGNPYYVSGFDASGDVGIDYGVYGVPETFVIDKAGHIRYKHIGPITPQSLAEEIVPVIEKLRSEKS